MPCRNRKGLGYSLLQDLETGIRPLPDFFEVGDCVVANQFIQKQQFFLQYLS